MSHWNFRIVENDGLYGIHEAYYEDGVEKPHSISKESMSPFGETFEELKEDVEKFVVALDKPILHYKDFSNSEKT